MNKIECHRRYLSSITMFRINWISRLTDATGHGEPVYTEADALEEISKLNTAWPEFIHSIEKIETLTPLNVKGHRCSYGDPMFVAYPSPTDSEESTPIAVVYPKPSPSLKPLASLPSVKEEVSQPQSSPPPSDFSTSFF